MVVRINYGFTTPERDFYESLIQETHLLHIFLSSLLIFWKANVL